MHPGSSFSKIFPGAADDIWIETHKASNKLVFVSTGNAVLTRLIQRNTPGISLWPADRAIRGGRYVQIKRPLTTRRRLSHAVEASGWKAEAVVCFA
jgi:hypothetical protein